VGGNVGAGISSQRRLAERDDTLDTQSSVNMGVIYSTRNGRKPEIPPKKELVARNPKHPRTLTCRPSVMLAYIIAVMGRIVPMTSVLIKGP